MAVAPLGKTSGTARYREKRSFVLEPKSVIESGSRCSQLKSQQRGKAGGKEKFASFQRLGTKGVGRHLSKRQLLPPPAGKQWARASIGGGRGDMSQHSRLDSHRETGHQLSDRCHSDSFQYSPSSAPGPVCSHFFEASSQNCGSLCNGYSLIIMELISSTWGRF